MKTMPHRYAALPLGDAGIAISLREPTRLPRLGRWLARWGHVSLKYLGERLGVWRGFCRPRGFSGETIVGE